VLSVSSSHVKTINKNNSSGIFSKKELPTSALKQEAECCVCGETFPSLCGLVKHICGMEVYVGKACFPTP
jgi:hypothetical protein